MKRKIKYVVLGLLFVCKFSNCYAMDVKQYNFTSNEGLYDSSKWVNLNGYGTETAYRNYDFFDEEGLYNSLYTSNNNVYWSKYDNEMNLINTYSWPLYYTKEGLSSVLESLFKPFGGAIYYNKHLYVLYTKPAYGDTRDEQYEKNVFALAKYDKKGNQVALKEYKGIHLNANGISYPPNKSEGTQIPFYGTASMSMTINDGVLAMFFGRNMFNSHESSQLAFFDTDDLAHLSEVSASGEENTPFSRRQKYSIVVNHSISHSLGQRIIRTSDGGYLIAEAGDAGNMKVSIGDMYDDTFLPTRGLIVSKIQEKYYESANVNALNRYPKRMFHFSEAGEGQWGNNFLNSSIGNILELNDGYMYIGAMERELNGAFGHAINAPHQLVVQKFKKDFYLKDNEEDMMILNTPVRSVTGNKATSSSISGTKIYLNGTEKDYGLKFLTNISDSSIIMERAIKLDDSNIAIIWEQDRISKDSTGGYNLSTNNYETYYMVIDKDANVIVPATKLDNAVMSGAEQYPCKNGIIYWTTTKSNKIIVNKLNPLKAIESVYFKEQELEIEYGNSLKLEALIDPVDTVDDKTLVYESSNPKVARVKSDGTVEALYPGETNITVKTSNNKSASIKIIVTGDVPFIKGDLNQDGSVDLLDVMVALRISLKLISYNNSSVLIGDIDGNGSIDLVDVMYILRLSLGLIK